MARSSILHDHDDEFQTRNNFLYFLLGLVAASRKLEERLLASQTGAEAEGDGSQPADRREGDPGDLRDLLI